MGEELAPTDAGECTRIITWYRDGVTYRVTLYPLGGGEPEPVRFHRHEGALDVDLGTRVPEEVERLVVEWPSASLRDTTLIDTPGMGSLTEGVSERTQRFLGDGGGDEPSMPTRSSTSCATCTRTTSTSSRRSVTTPASALR